AGRQRVAACRFAGREPARRQRRWHPCPPGPAGADTSSSTSIAALSGYACLPPCSDGPVYQRLEFVRGIATDERGGKSAWALDDSLSTVLQYRVSVFVGPVFNRPE